MERPTLSDPKEWRIVRAMYFDNTDPRSEDAEEKRDRDNTKRIINQAR